MSDPGNPDIEDEIEDIGFRFAAMLGGVMKEDKEDTDDLLELYGTSPFVIVLLLGLVTLFLPIGGIGFIFNFEDIPLLLYSPIWMAPYNGNILVAFLWFILHPWEFLQTIWITLPLCTLNFLFIIQIHRFFSNTASRDIALLYGMLSMILPTVVTLFLWITYSFPFVITPIPIQFIVGMYLLYKFRDPDYISPWEGYFIDWSWWERQKYDIEDPDAKVIRLFDLLMQHDADWLEGYDD